MFRGGETTWLIIVHDFLSNAAMNIDVLGLTSFPNVPCVYINICTFDYLTYIYTYINFYTCNYIHITIYMSSWQVASFKSHNMYIYIYCMYFLPSLIHVFLPF